MITKRELKYYSSLLHKKYRSSENKFIVEGEKCVMEGLKSAFHCETVFVTNEFLEQKKTIKNANEHVGIRLIVLKPQDFKKISDTKSPQGIAAVFNKKKSVVNISNLAEEKIIVYLDNISDPGNAGTIIRNCHWFGIKNILLCKNSSEFTNPKVIRSSMGSVFHLNIYEEIDSSAIKQLKDNGFEILCSDVKGENVFSFNRKEKIVLTLSNESHGPSNEIKNLADQKISIPGKGNAESLNVASASAVILAELTK